MFNSGFSSKVPIFVNIFISGSCFLRFTSDGGEAIYQLALLGGADRMDKRGQSQCVSYTCTSHGGGGGRKGRRVVLC